MKSSNANSEILQEVNYKGFTIKILNADPENKKYEKLIYEIYREKNYLAGCILNEKYDSILNAIMGSQKLIDSDEFKNTFIERESVSVIHAKSLSKTELSNAIEPSHYGGKDNVYEAIKIIQHYKLDFCLGNSVKYIIRAGKKDPEKEIEDLQKAHWYLETKIKELENSKINNKQQNA